MPDIDLWPIWTLPVADLVFSMAAMVVADMVCSRYRCNSILFIIYINDLPDLCQEFVEIYLFADGAKLYKHVTSEDDHFSLQLGLDVLQEWSDRWLLKLNITKCETVFCGRNINHDYDYYLH